MMRTREKEVSHYSPQPRRPIHPSKMEQDDVILRSNQNLKYGRQDELSDYSDDHETFDDPYSDDHETFDDPDDRESLDTNVDQGLRSKYKTTTVKPEENGKQPSIFIEYIPRAVAVVVAVVAAVIYLYSNGEAEEKVLPPLSITGQELMYEKILRSDIQHIRDEFPSQLKSIWRQFSSGIKMVKKDPTRPSVFLLLHETDEGTPACLAQKIGRIATQFLNATNSRPLVLEGADLEHNETLVEDYGTLIEEYRPKVEEQRTMIVYNLHKIPAIVAQSFHSFCDTIMPVVDKAVYLFTMKTSGVNHAGNSPTKLAEKELMKLWGGQLDRDILIPLIVRITDTVMVIIPEGNLVSCQR